MQPVKAIRKIRHQKAEKHLFLAHKKRKLEEWGPRSTGEEGIESCGSETRGCHGAVSLAQYLLAMVSNFTQIGSGYRCN